MSGNELYFQYRQIPTVLSCSSKEKHYPKALIPSSSPKAPRSLIRSRELAVRVWKTTNSTTNREQVTTADG